MKTSGEEKEISYTSKNTYSTLNTISKNTKHIWFVCHGMGYLSRYFLKYFKVLDPNENYIIAPQAPSKYYQQPKMHVGANWLTRDNTQMGIDNILNYFDAIYGLENLDSLENLIVMGYSQGVSVVLRYMASRKIQFQKLLIHSGGIPTELSREDFEYLNYDAEIQLIYGTRDEYLDAHRIAQEQKRARNLFGDRVLILPFDGIHEVNTELLKAAVTPR